VCKCFLCNAPVLSLNINGQILILIGTKILYNIYLHPLARFPGPKAYAISSIPIAWVQLSGKAHHSIQAAHRRYGPVVRISPNELSFISSTAWSDIYARNKGNPPLPRDRTFFNKMLVDPQTLTMASDVDHTRLRRSMNPAFSARAFREQEPIIQKNVDLLMQQLESRAAKGLSTDMRTWYNYTTFDLIGDLAFGESFGCLATSAYHEWVEFVLSHFYTSTLLQVAHRFRPFNRILVALLPASMMERRVKHDEMTLKKVRRRLDSKAERQDFISQMLDSVDSGSMSIQELEKQASILILAGSETTSVALTFATYYLLHNNSCLVKLTDEIRQSFQKESEIDLLSVNRLQFLQAVIQEAMRLRPPIANGFPRETPAGGATVDGQFVPGQVRNVCILNSS
jgi:cytochrome P450